MHDGYGLIARKRDGWVNLFARRGQGILFIALSTPLTGCVLRTDPRFEISRGQKRIEKIKMVASPRNQD